ncbi:MAG: putative Ig domain-containing protein [Ignavibacteriae bacterium]|nr:putative Ig domain-containing protein [Ignavibacteriota bacterium]
MKKYFSFAVFFMYINLVYPQQFIKTIYVEQKELTTGSADKKNQTVRWTNEPLIFVGDNTGIGSGDYRGWIEFNVDNFPTKVVVNKVELRIYCASSSNSGHKLMIRQFGIDGDYFYLHPTDLSPLNYSYLYDHAATGTIYVDKSSLLANTTVGWKVFDLGNKAVADFQKIIDDGDGRFSLGLQEYGDDDNPPAQVYGSTSKYKPYLTITMTDINPPTSPGTPTENNPDIDFTNTQFTVMWNSSYDYESGFDHYELFEQVNNGQWSRIASPTSTTSYVRDLPEGNYYYYVKAFDKVGNGSEISLNDDGILVDKTKPTNGIIKIENGAATSRTLKVNLNNISATDNSSGIEKMKFCNDNSSWSSWENYSSTRSNWDLSQNGGNSNPGIKKVYIRFKDKAGNESSSFYDEIEYIVPTISVNNPEIDCGNAVVGYESEVVSFNISCKNLEGDVTITAPNNFKVSKYSNTNFTSSLNISNNNNSFTGTIYVKFYPNVVKEYADKIKITSQNANDVYVNVYGDGEEPFIKVSPTSLEIGFGSGSTGKFEITSNINWKIAGKPDWLNVSPDKGNVEDETNNSNVTVTATSANSTTSSRTATMTISGTGVSNKTVTVTQAGNPNTAPVITTAAVTNGVVGQLYSYDVDATGNPAPTYSLTTSPSGMTINSTSGIIQWTPSSSGSYNVTVKATNGVSPDASQSFTIVVALPNTAPVITTAAVTNGVVGQLYSYNVDATGNPAPTYSLTTSPSGMTINSTSGIIQWTPSSSGSYNVTVKATNGVSPDASQSFTIVVALPNTAPVITTAAVTNGVVGQMYSYDVDATGNPAPTYSLTTSPSGMTINSTSGLIQWTPSSSGSYNVTVKASNGVSPDASQSFTIVVALPNTAPVITTAAVTNGVVGQLYSYDVDATGNPAPTYSLTTSPSGMTINSTSGLIQWTPSSSGSYNVTVKASNGVSPDASQSFTIVVALPNTAPVITTAAVTNGVVGQLYSYNVDATGNPAPTYSLTTSPSGMTINSTSGIIQWTPSSSGSYNVTVKATNGVSPDASQSFTIVVALPNTAPVITTAAVTNGVVGQLYSYDVDATGNPAPTYSLTTSPSGMTINSTSGIIQWTPSSSGSYNVTVKATNGVSPDASQSFTIVVALPNTAPVITTAAVTNGVVGQLYSYDVDATGNPAPTYSLTTSPSGMTINSTSGIIQWTPSSSGSYNVTVKATNGVSPDASQSFTIVVALPNTAPVITTAAVTNGVVGQMYSYDVDATGNPAPTYSLTTSPSGMTINSTSGIIQWTPSSSGSYNVTVKASNGVSPDASQSFTIVVALPNTALVITTAAVTNGVVGQMYSYDVDATGNPAPTYSLTTSPSGMTINSTSGLIQWTPSSSGSYNVTVKASNGVSPDASQSFTIVVPELNTDPVITLQPISQTINEGQTVTFKVEANCSSPLEFQWWGVGSNQWNNGDKNGRITIVNESNSSTLKITNVNFTIDNNNEFTCEVINTSGGYPDPKYWENSNTVKLTVNVNIPSPTELNVVTFNDQSIEIKWVDNSKTETNYIIERKEGNSGSWSERGRVDANVVTYKDINLGPNTTYCYRVRAYNGNGSTYSGYSNEVCATTSPYIPNTPTELNVVTFNDQNIEIKWVDNSKTETNYIIERKEGNSGSWSERGRVDANVVTYKDINLGPNTTYCYRVRAYNGNGSTYSGYSNEVCATTSPYIPNTPTELNVVTFNDQSIEIKWVDNSKTETNYIIERKEGNSGSWSERGRVDANVVTYKDINLGPNTTYCYRVRAYNGNGSTYSGYSNEVCATTSPYIPNTQPN